MSLKCLHHPSPLMSQMLKKNKKVNLPLKSKVHKPNKPKINKNHLLIVKEIIKRF